MNALVLKEILKNHSPVQVRKVLREVMRQYRSFRNALLSDVLDRSLDEVALYRSLVSLGIREGDTVIVHSSLSRLGHVEGGAPSVVGALLRAVGSSGTIGAPTFWGNTTHYLQGNLTFDVRHSPSILGAISECIRRHPEARRSLHPTHSAAFIGPLSEDLVGNHHRDSTPVGPNSPYMRLVGVRGKILLLGVSLEYLTSFHTIEDCIRDFPEKVYLDQPLEFTVIDYTGIPRQVTMYCHCPETGNKRQCNRMEHHLMKHGVIKRHPIGASHAMLLDADLLHRTLINLYQRGITMYSPGY